MLATLGLCSVGLIPNCYGQVKEPKRPNILFIMSDYEYPADHAVKRHYGVRTDRYKLIHLN